MRGLLCRVNLHRAYLEAVIGNMARFRCRRCTWSSTYWVEQP